MAKTLSRARGITPKKPVLTKARCCPILASSRIDAKIGLMLKCGVLSFSSAIDTLILAIASFLREPESYEIRSLNNHFIKYN